MQIVAATATARGGVAEAADLAQQRGRRQHAPRIDDDVFSPSGPRRFHEESERKPRDDADAGETMPPPARQRLFPAHETVFAGAEPREVREAVVGRAPSCARPLERDGVRRTALLRVAHDGADETRRARVDLVGHARRHAHAAHRLLRQRAGDHDEREHHRLEEIEEVVAGVHRGEAEPDRDRETPPAFASGTDRAPRAPERPHAPDPRDHRPMVALGP